MEKKEGFLVFTYRSFFFFFFYSGFSDFSFFTLFFNLILKISSEYLILFNIKIKKNKETVLGGDG